MIPVGGVYTINGTDAKEVIAENEPREANLVESLAAADCMDVNIFKVCVWVCIEKQKSQRKDEGLI